MAQWKSLGGGAALVALLGSTAQAEVTAAEVWQSWKDLTTSMGQTLTVESEEMSGDTLTVTNMAMKSESVGVTATGTLASIAFEELGDGTVAVTMSPEYPVIITTKVEGEDPVVVALTVRQTDLRMIASGSVDALSYDVSAPELAIILDNVSGMPDGGAVDLTATFKGVAGKYTVASGEKKVVGTEFKADLLSVDVKVDDPTPETGGSGAFTVAIAALQSASNATFAPETDFQDMPAALAAGFATDGTMTYGKTTFSFNFTDPTSNGKANGTIANGGFNFALDAARMGYGSTTNGTDITVSSSDMPFPAVTITLAEAAFNFLMPVMKSTEPQDFSMLTKLVGFSISDEIWGMIDPTAVLPHDPATVILDVAGKGNWLVDIMDQSLAEDTSGKVPGELHALTLKQLQVTAAGADLSGTGDFTFDNTDTATIPGMPKPTGSIDVKLVGGNGLLDKLVLMGVLPEDQSMGAKMMMGMFGRTVEGAEDTLTSQIEFKADGGIFANGQQIQ